jgi:hypothetical protein
MLTALLVYLAIDAVISLITLGLGIYLLRTRGAQVRYVLRQWLGIKEPMVHHCEVHRHDFDENGIYLGKLDDANEDEYELDSYDDNAFVYEDEEDLEDPQNKVTLKVVDTNKN